MISRNIFKFFYLIMGLLWENFTAELHLGGLLGNIKELEQQPEGDRMFSHSLCTGIFTCHLPLGV